MARRDRPWEEQQVELGGSDAQHAMVPSRRTGPIYRPTTLGYCLWCTQWLPTLSADRQRLSWPHAGRRGPNGTMEAREEREQEILDTMTGHGKAWQVHCLGTWNFRTRACPVRLARPTTNWTNQLRPVN